MFRLILNWYDKHHRILPWRTTPSDRSQGKRADPYHVWLSEIMLQQTTVEAVKSYFSKFIQLWPDIHAMSRANEDDILRAWAGLGYYTRARNLKKCADIIVKDYDGHFPEDVNELKKLPGIGDYTSAAISTIAFDKPAPVVDGNIERVITRLFAIETPLPAAKVQIKELVAQIMPAKRSGDFAQAMMDLGATICTPRRPSCILCPLKEQCIALKTSDPELFPFKAPKKERPVRQGSAFVAINTQQQVLLRKRTAKGLLHNMSEVPGSFWNASTDGATDLSAAPFAADWQFKGVITHIFTHFELHLHVYRADNIDSNITNDGWWVAIQDLRNEALPTVMKKAITAAIKDAFKK